MKRLENKLSDLEVRKQLIISMINADPELFRWLQGIVKAYGE